jgi:hypothetical protein
VITSSHEGCWGQVIFCSCVEVSTHSNSRYLPRLAVSHGGAKLIELRSPRHGVSRTPGRPKHCSRQYDRDGGLRARDKPCGSRYRPPRRSDHLSSGQRAIRSAGIASSARALPHLRPRHRRTSHPVAAYRGGHQNSSYSRSSGSERAEPIFITASCSQDVMRFARRDPARVNFPRGWRGSPLTLRAGSGRFQHSPLRHFSLCHVAPERD